MKILLSQAKLFFVQGLLLGWYLERVGNSVEWVFHSQTGDKYAAALFKEYAFAFLGKRQLFYSQGLKDFFQIKNLTDDEILKLRDPDEVSLIHIKP